MRHVRMGLAAALAATLAGCATWGPTWSEVTGTRFERVSPAGLNVAPVVITNVDDRGAFPNAADQPTRIEPGRRRIVVQALPLSGGWGGRMDLEVLMLDAEPCRRYYVNAKFENPLGRAYTPFVAFVESIAGCQLPAKP
jgi:hypothetical protein